MAWLFAIVVLLIVSAWFRGFALVVIAIVVVGGGAFYLHNEEQSKLYKQQEDLSKSRIPATQVAITGPAINWKYGIYHFSGRITNNSPNFTLSQVELFVTARDCVENSAPRSCVTIGEDSRTIYINVPPGQSRDFDESLYFPGNGPVPRGELDWQYNISQTRASVTDV